METTKKVLDKVTKTKRKQSKTIRLTVDLSNKDENGCAVFNYRELVKAEMERRKQQKPKEHNDNTDYEEEEVKNEDEALKRIALQYEEKYGSNSNNMRCQTYTELGAGYDENDSFIDNTEACEEILPEDTEPIRGGFYVNCGKLEFKTSPGQLDPRKTKRKQIQEMDVRCILDEDDVNTDVKKAKIEIKFDVKEDAETKLSNGKFIKRITPKPVPQVSDEVLEPQDNLPKVDPMKADQSPVNELILDNQLILNEKKEYFSVNLCDIDQNENSADTNISNSETSNSDDKDITQGLEPASLPANISPEISSYINELKSQALKNQGSQRKFFGEQTNIILLKCLETKCRMELSSSCRQKVYEYLAYYLPYTKSTLISKARNVFSGADQLESLLSRISSVIKSCDTIDSYDFDQKTLEESKEYLQKVTQIKIREYIVKRSLRKLCFEAHLNDFLSGLVQLWPIGSKISVSRLQSLLQDTIQSEAEAFNLNYLPYPTVATDLTTHNVINEPKSPDNNSEQNALSKDEASPDDKVQMQVNQVLQDLVVLSQMSLDTSPTAKI